MDSKGKYGSGSPLSFPVPPRCQSSGVHDCVCTPAPPQSGPLFHGPLPTASILPQESETIRSVRCPCFADGKAEAQVLLSLGACSPLGGGGAGSKWLLAPCLHPRLAHAFDFEQHNINWSSSMQGSFQAAGIFVSLAMALVGGIIVGE